MAEPNSHAMGREQSLVAADSPLGVTLVRQMALASSEAAHLSARRAGTVISLRVSRSAWSRVAGALGLDTLPSNNTSASTRAGSCLWVRPDEWLVIGADASRGATAALLETALGPDDGAVVDISASRIVLELSGSASREVLASCCPLDLHPRSFATAHCAQSLVAKVPVLLHLVDETPRWNVYVRPSLAAYVVAWLTDAMSGGATERPDA